MEYFHAVCRDMTMFYPGGAEQFLEVVLSISEKVRGLARKSVGDLNARRRNGRRPVTKPALVACT
jgi:hypothetical protein